MYCNTVVAAQFKVHFYSRNHSFALMLQSHCGKQWLETTAPPKLLQRVQN